MTAETPSPQRAERSAEVFGLLARIVHRTAQDAAAALRTEQLNPAQFQLLRAVRDDPGASQQTFGDRFAVTRSNVSMLVTKLVDAGLLVREPRGADPVRQVSDMSAGPASPTGDVVRQWATIVGALGQAVLPAVILPRLRRDLQPPDVVQPAPWAFAIWLPVYAAAAAHAARQARPALRTDPVLRDAGWPLAAAYLCIGGWAPLLQRRRYWAAQGALTGAAVFAGIARVRLDRTAEDSIPASVALSTGLLSGWGAAASGVNLASMVVGVGAVPNGRPATLTGIATALALGGLGAATLPDRATTLTQRAYASTLLWALAGVADGQRRTSPSIAVAAALAAVPVARRLLPGAVQELGQPRRDSRASRATSTALASVSAARSRAAVVAVSRTAAAALATPCSNATAAVAAVRAAWAAAAATAVATAAAARAVSSAVTIAAASTVAASRRAARAASTSPPEAMEAATISAA